jgi:hypothetical protein
LLFRIAESAFDETQMIAQNKAAIPLLQAVGRGGFRNEPVIGRIIIAQLQRRGLGMKPDQAAFAAFDDLERFCGGVIQAISGRKERASLGTAAGRTLVPIQLDCSEISWSEIR